MPSINTYYPQAMYDKITTAAKTVFGEGDRKKIDKFLKACLNFGIDHLEEVFEVQLKEKTESG